MSGNDKKAIVIISVIRTIAEISGNISDKQAEIVGMMNKVLDFYSGTITQLELNKIEFKLTQIFQELIKRNFTIDADVVYSMIIFFSQKFLQHITYVPKRKVWDDLENYGIKNLSDKFDNKLTDAADEVVDFLFDMVNMDMNEEFYQHNKKIKIKKGNSR